jgi:translation initiation factor 1
MEEICTICGLPKSLCICKEIGKESQKIRIRVISKKFKKVVTLIEGLEDKKQAKELEKLLKRKLACGGTSRDHEIELQGNHRGKVKDILLKEGYKEELIEE